MEILDKIWNAIPDSVKAVLIQVCLVGGYTFVFVVLQTYTQNWQASVALTAGFRAALIAIVQVLETPKATNAEPVAPRKFSSFM